MQFVVLALKNTSSLIILFKDESVNFVVPPQLLLNLSCYVTNGNTHRIQLRGGKPLHSLYTNTIKNLLVNQFNISCEFELTPKSTPPLILGINLTPKRTGLKKGFRAPLFPSATTLIKTCGYSFKYIFATLNTLCTRPYAIQSQPFPSQAIA